MMPQADLTQVAAFQNACKQLWEAGVLSNETLLKNYGIDVQTEFDKKKKEIAAGQQEVFVKPGASSNDNVGDENSGTIGRPTLDDSERQSDPGNSETGRQPKPSSEEGSEAQQ
jgi:hypothetical protein